MKGIILKFGIIVLFAAVFGLTLSCSTSTGSNDDSDIGGKVTGTYGAYFYDSESFTGGSRGGVYVLPPDSEADATLPEHWWRTIDEYASTITITDYNGERAEVTVQWDIEGTMYIDRDFDQQVNPHTKPLSMSAYVKGEFIYDGEDWVLNRISPINYVTTGNDQTVEIVSVRVQSNNFDRTYTDPDEMLDLEDLPLFQEGDEVTVTITSTNSSTEEWDPPTFGFVHHDRMRDNATYEGEGVFVKEYVIGANEGVHHGAADIIDAGTLQNETNDDYNSHVWSIPYHVGSIPTN